MATTSSAATFITPDQDAIVSEIYIAAPPEHVFTALTDAKKVSTWWTGPECPIKTFTMEPKLGGRWTYDSAKGSVEVNGVTKFHAEGEVLEYDPPRVLAYTWFANWQDDPKKRTVVRWDLTPKDNGTHLKMTHSGLSDLPVARKDYVGGWPGVLAQVKNFVES